MIQVQPLYLWEMESVVQHKDNQVQQQQYEHACPSSV